MAGLSRADVEHVAYLARLGLTEEELTRLEGQLNHILDQYAILAELPTDEIPPTAQTIELENILREDTARPSLSVDEALAGAPRRSGGLFVVPAIIGGTEDNAAAEGIGRAHDISAAAGTGAAGDIGGTAIVGGAEE